MFHAFVDESGDEGVTQSSSAWLCLGAFIIRETEINPTKQYLANGVKNVWRGSRPPAHVHFQQISSHSKRKALLHMLCGLNFTAVVICSKKSSFREETLRALKCPTLYNYLAKHLLERLSWFAHDYGQKVRVSFASRNQISWTDFETYIELLRDRPDKHQIRFETIDSIGNIPANMNSCVQAADWITSGVACGLNPDEYDNVETAYAEILWGKFWVRKGNLWSYGIKCVPQFDSKKEKLFRKIGTWLEDPTTIV